MFRDKAKFLLLVARRFSWNAFPRCYLSINRSWGDEGLCLMDFRQLDYRSILFEGIVRVF